MALSNQVPRDRQLAEGPFEGLVPGRQGRRLTAYIPPRGVPTYGPAVHLGAALLAKIGAFAVNGTYPAGPQAPPSLTFIGE